MKVACKKKVSIEKRDQITRVSQKRAYRSAKDDPEHVSFWRLKSRKLTAKDDPEQLWKEVLNLKEVMVRMIRANDDR
jgi:hypothetical protein